ncbi:alpha/beta fold hydrolase [Nocardia farcinica]|uniref:alpha/beta fold hydrolase n=1 Tax=Nocardia farcinica TaxID=37329 RepID=UPI001894DE10|nr:alpha/beta hydrolase [Nocardia farcinica]MBF6258373.1 alpha/beta fold hydrolase [Nocardia farcinica]
MTIQTNVTAESTSRFVGTRSYRMHYYEAGAGTPIIMLHGSGPGATGWSNFWPNIAVLAENFRVLAVDMPGWGKSETEDAQRGNDHTQFVIDFMDAVGIDRAALVGNSMGGMTALKVAAFHPSRVSHLITMGSSAPGPNYFAPAGGPSEGLKVLREAYEEPSAANMKRLVQIMCYDQSIATDELAALRSEAALANRAHLASFLIRKWIPDNGTLLPALQKSTVPALFFHGRDDRVVTYENSLRLASIVPNSRLLLINRCGHWLQIEHAHEFNRTVAQFVSSN